MTKEDKELLEMAAKAAGYEVIDEDHYGHFIVGHIGQQIVWNPLTDDGDALRLAVKLNLSVHYEPYDSGIAVLIGGEWDNAPEAVHEIFERDGCSATRRAIARASAEIGRSMP